MSTSRTVLRLGNQVAAASCSKSARRYLASKAGSTSESTTSSTEVQPTVYASLLLSRPPLLTPTPTELESTYYNYTSSIQHALSNPPSQTNAFYFKAGSLPLRRFQTTQHEFLTKTYGKDLAGSAPDIGDVPAETPVQAFERDHWVKADSKRGEKSLERHPTEEVFCLVKGGKSGKWEIPKVGLKQGESLDDAVGRIRGIGGMMDGEKMDSWLVTRKPIGSIKNGQETTFFLRSHILAGEPKFGSGSPYSAWAWLTPKEVEERLRSQGDDEVWQGIRAMFGLGDQQDL